MNEPTLVLMAWLLFGASHVLLGFPPLRGVLARRLGEQRFVALFSAVAALTLGVLFATVARYGGEGLPGPALGSTPLLRYALGVLGFAGLVLALAAVRAYPRTPMALFTTRIRPPSGIARVTRHGFFVGMTMFATAHALLAPTLAGSVYFGGFAALALVGALWQDRKLLARHGTAYADYMAATSILPFLALLQGRQRFTAEDRMPALLARAGAIALLLLALHPLWSAWHGAPLAGLMALGGGFIAVRRLRVPPRAEGIAPRASPN